MSDHTRVVHRREAFAKGLIWGAAGLTMTILILIVGYVVVNGVFARDVADDEVTPFVQESIRLLPDRSVRASLVATRSLRLRDLTYDQVVDVVAGELTFWGYITGQNRNVTVYVADTPAFGEAVSAYLQLTPSEFSDEVIRAEDPAQLAREIRAADGAIAIVPTEWVDGMRRVRRVGVRQLSVVVHPDVPALQAGRRLTELSGSRPNQVHGLLSGSTDVWSEIGGPSIEIEPADPPAGDPGVYRPLPVVPVLFSPSAGLHADLVSAYLAGVEASPGAIYAESVDEFAETIRSTPGSVGLLRRPEALQADLDSMSVRRVTRRVNLRPSFFLNPPSRAGAVGGVSYIIINTLTMIAFVLAIATPTGVAAAVYLVEYAKQGRLLRILRIGTDTLAGIPSIIFGLFGLVFFAQFLRLKTGLLSGALTLTLMILPTLVRTSEEALRNVPRSLREGSLALGVTKLQTIVHVVLPAAAPGILTGVILGIGRAVGETAALLFTMGSNLALIRNINSPMRVLSVHLYMLVREDISLPNAFATATILVIIVFLVNYATTRLIGGRQRAAGQ